MDFEIRPLSDVLGAEVIGLDLRKGLVAAEFERVHRAWLDHLLLVFRDQHLSEQQHVDFSRRLGELEIHPNKPALHPQHPELFVLSNVLEEGKPVGKGSTPYWHTDMSYVAQPPKASILYGREVPEIGGDTLFTNMYRAYAALPADIKETLKGRKAVHNIADFAARYARLSGDPDALQNAVSNPAWIRAYPDVVHPVVIRHPETGLPAIYVNEGFTTRILGVPVDESDALLALLFAHYSRPEFTYRIKWRRNDLILWDNRCTNHSATGGYKAPMRRLMHRTTVCGEGMPVAA